MKHDHTVINIERFCNTLEFAGVALALALAGLIQLFFNELPCPLCLLQRIGLCCVALGFLMNLRFGLHPSHYAMIILASLFTSFVALRQVALHVIPGTKPYGSPVFGLHLYTWTFIICMIIMIVTTLMLCVERQYADLHSRKIKKANTNTNILFAILLFILCGNIVAAYMECGFGQCPDNPQSYKLE